MSPAQSNSFVDIGSNRQHILCTSRSTSPLIDLNSITSDINGIPFINPSSNYLNRSITSSDDDLFDFENVKVSPIGTSGIQSFGSKMQNLSLKPKASLNNEKRRTRVQNSWKLVLNAISLSAAKVSVGLSPKTCHDFENLTPDFINAKSAENKISIANGRYSKGDIFNVKDSNEYKSTIEQCMFTHGNIQKYPTINDSIAQSHYYNESGFLSMYDYNSDNGSSL